MVFHKTMSARSAVPCHARKSIPGATALTDRRCRAQLSDAVPFARCRSCHWRGLYGKKRGQLCVSHMAPDSNGFLPGCTDYRKESKSQVAVPPAAPRTLAELARACGRKREWIYSRVRNGTLKGLLRGKHRGAGRQWLIPAADFQKLVKRFEIARTA